MTQEAREKAQLVKALPATLDDLSFVTQWIKRTDSCKVTSDLQVHKPQHLPQINKYMEQTPEK